MSGAVSGCVCIQTRQAPRVPLPASRYCLFCSVSSRDTSGGVTLPSSLIRTHAPILSPPNASVCRLVHSVFAGCYPPPAGKSTFPTLSLRIFLYVLGPLPRLLLWCSPPFLHTRLRPSPSQERVGAYAISLLWQFQQGKNFGAAVIRLCSGP